jgi:predicted DNA-binding transcriptional regulator YafY
VNLIQNINKLEKLHHLINTGKTGSPKQLANQLQIDRTSLYIMIDELNALNLKISYSRKYETFYYEKDEEMKSRFTEKEIRLN